MRSNKHSKSPSYQASQGLSLEARMVLKTLEACPMTISALERHWRPTWSIDEVKQIVHQLQQKRLIRLKDRVLERGQYVSCVRVSSATGRSATSGKARS